ncbi:MAG: Holliday junction branch migration protein RuvA [Clostridiales bacterium]|jgi:Holliday junction DNA helicase RuvA|nr:Holliday junction branch migration protein RuvA [Clostridiales bacterium]HOB64362.1 Holliday junction branch migration protein RuvA [Clostridia bacterium]HOK81421.1 Holliday junction branch migration protein RuvA [Clostridia bacterium]HOL60721.1 Holliday junction branch migration protein RuvA [Clostridia bacterium]HPO53296.1 Holliday junction branch migration protein RuvA [Clostridia bacterium]
MLSYIKGILTGAEGSTVIIEAGGIGYEILATNSAIVNLPPIGKEAKLYVFLSVKEDGMSLYGFRSPEEKNMFSKLTTVSGVGPKLAMSILSGMDLSSLALCIITGDTRSISRIKGIGKKTAERIILELKEKVGEDSAGVAADAVEIPSGQDKDAMDAITALRALGISMQEANNAVKAVRGRSSTIEELITNALRSLNG